MFVTPNIVEIGPDDTLGWNGSGVSSGVFLLKQTPCRDCPSIFFHEWAVQI